LRNVSAQPVFDRGIVMALWVIRIVAAAHPEDPPQFVPQLQSGGPQGLLAQAGDSVSWTNDTMDMQQPWPADANFKPLPVNQVGQRGQPNSNYLSDAIPPGHSSRPNWIVFGNAGTAINYCSLPNPLAQGVITITS
jgi:hypothetical protein